MTSYLFSGKTGSKTSQRLSHRTSPLANTSRVDDRYAYVHAVGTCASGIAHDMNNLLGAIMNYASAIQRAQPGSDIGRRAAGHIEEIASVAGDICRNVLEVANTQPSETIQIASMVRSLASIAIPTTSKSPRYSVEAEDEDIHAEVDATSLMQVIVNLCKNADDAVGGSGKVEIKIERSDVLPDHSEFDAVYADNADRNRQYAVMSIHDDGGGVPDELLPIICNESVTTRPWCAGMGLSTVRDLVHANRGLLALNSTSHGAEFVVYLPLAESI